MKPLWLAAVLLTAPLSAIEKQAITHEDVWLMKRIGVPALSPDGRWAVFSVTRPSYEKDETVSDLFLVPTDGRAAPRQLTSTSGSEGGLVWSPDAGRLAFTARRGKDEAKQVYVLDMTVPGEPRRVTSLSTGAANPVWSPDGRSLAFESVVYPGAGDDEANRKEAKKREERLHRASVYDGFPIRFWDHWRDDRQVHLFVQDLDSPRPARDLLAGSALVAAPGYSGLIGRSGDHLDAVWTPDGKALVFAAITNLREAARASLRTRLYRVAADGAEPTPLTSGTASFSEPRFGSHGRFLFALMEPETEYVYNHTRAVRFSWPKPGEPVVLGAGFDRSVNQIAVGPDGQSLYVTAYEHGRARIFVLPAAGGPAQALDDQSGGFYRSLRTPTRGPGLLLARWQDATHPTEIVRVDPRTGQRTSLTALNAEHAARIDWRPFQEFWFESSQGRRIHNWIVLPPGFDPDKRYPLLLFIHGGPYSTSLDSGHLRWNAHLLAAPGYVVLLTDYTGSVGYGEAFSRAIQGDPLKTPAEELIEAADEAVRRFSFIDGSRQAASGASYGGHLVNWLLGTTDRFRCLVGHAGLINLESQWGTSDTIYHRERANGGPVWEQGPVWREQNPARRAAHFKTPILLTAGENDFRVPINQTIEAWSYLQRLEVPSRLLVFHDTNHWIMRGHDAKFFFEQVHAWLAQYLK